MHVREKFQDVPTNFSKTRHDPPYVGTYSPDAADAFGHDIAYTSQTRTPLPRPTLVSSSTPRCPSDMIFSAEETKGRDDFFIAGRGGETNFHKGNNTFRKRVLEHTETYAGLKTCDRGRKFARKLRNRYFGDVTFVVRHSYFFKNLQKGTISQEKIESVRKEHGGDFDTLRELPADYYFTVGETWILGIISDIVRFGGKKSPTCKKRKTETSTSFVTVSDDESSTLEGERSPKRSRRHSSVKNTPHQKLSSLPHKTRSFAPFIKTPTSSLPSVKAYDVSPMHVRSQDTENLSDQLAELHALVNLPLPSAEDEASMFDEEEMVLDFLGGIVPI